MPCTIHLSTNDLNMSSINSDIKANSYQPLVTCFVNETLIDHFPAAYLHFFQMYQVTGFLMVDKLLLHRY
jgi:hypothetical protein